MFLLPPFYLSEPLLSDRNNLALGPKICRAGQLGCVRHSLNASGLLLSERLQIQEEREGPFQSFQWGKERGLTLCTEMSSLSFLKLSTLHYGPFPSNNS